MTDTITYKGRQVYLDEDPRQGVCNECRYVLGTTHHDTGKVYQRTHMHHLEYHDDDPLKDAIEYCPRCHKKKEWEGYKRKLMRIVRVDPDVHERLDKIGQRNETYGEIVKRLIKFYEDHS